MRPLPFEPHFVVYGVASDRLGPGELELWNQAGGLGNGPFTHVTLGYGPSAEPEAFVITYAKLDAHPATDAEPISYPATGITDAAISGLQYLYDEARQRGLTRFTSAAEEVNEITSLSSSLDEPDWTTHEFDVEGRRLPFRVHSVDEMWVALIDLPHVAVAVVGLRVTLSGLSIAPIDTHSLVKHE